MKLLLFLVFLCTSAPFSFGLKHQVLQTKRQRSKNVSSLHKKKANQPTFNKHRDDGAVSRSLQTDQEVCDAIYASEFKDAEQCTCTRVNDEFIVECLICDGAFALNKDIQYKQSEVDVYYKVRDQAYALKESTFTIVYSGADRQYTTVVIKETYDSRGRDETCELRFDETTCTCGYVQCDDGEGALVSNCPGQTIDPCVDHEGLPGAEDVVFDITPCLDGSLPPAFYNGGTVAPNPAPPPLSFTFSPSTSEPTTSGPPIISTATMACTDNSECPSFTCIGGVCRDFKSPPGGPCDGPIDVTDCENFVCGRATADPDSDYVCCESGVGYLPDSSTDTYCTGQPAGAACLDAQMCENGMCEDGFCAGGSPTTAAPTISPSGVINTEEPTGMPIQLTQEPTSAPIMAAPDDGTDEPTMEPTVFTGDTPTSTEAPTPAPVSVTGSPSVAKTSEPTPTFVEDKTDEPSAPITPPTEVTPTSTEAPAPAPIMVTESPSVSKASEPTPTITEDKTDEPAPTGMQNTTATPTLAPITTFAPTSNVKDFQLPPTTLSVVLPDGNTDISAAVDAFASYLTEQMKVAYKSFLRLELSVLPSRRMLQHRELQTTTIFMQGVAYFADSIPTSVQQSLITMLSNKPAIEKALREELGQDVSVEGAYLGTVTAAPTASPLMSVPTTTPVKLPSFATSFPPVPSKASGTWSAEWAALACVIGLWLQL